MVGWLIDWLVFRQSVGPLIGWSFDRLVHWLVGLLVIHSGSPFVDLSFSGLVRTLGTYDLVGWSFVRLVGQLFGWLVIQSVGPLLGLLVCWSFG